MLAPILAETLQRTELIAAAGFLLTGLATFATLVWFAARINNRLDQLVDQHRQIAQQILAELGGRDAHGHTIEGRQNTLRRRLKTAIAVELTKLRQSLACLSKRDCPVVDLDRPPRATE